jgi:hypothetical protein
MKRKKSASSRKEIAPNECSYRKYSGQAKMINVYMMVLSLIVHTRQNLRSNLLVRLYKIMAQFLHLLKNKFSLGFLRKLLAFRRLPSEPRTPCCSLANFAKIYNFNEIGAKGASLSAGSPVSLLGLSACGVSLGSFFPQDIE